MRRVGEGRRWRHVKSQPRRNTANKTKHCYLYQHALLHPVDANQTLLISRFVSSDTSNIHFPSLDHARVRWPSPTRRPLWGSMQTHLDRLMNHCLCNPVLAGVYQTPPSRLITSEWGSAAKTSLQVCCLAWPRHGTNSAPRPPRPRSIPNNGDHTPPWLSPRNSNCVYYPILWSIRQLYGRIIPIL